MSCSNDLLKTHSLPAVSRHPDISQWFPPQLPQQTYPCCLLSDSFCTQHLSRGVFQSQDPGNNFNLSPWTLLLQAQPTVSHHTSSPPTHLARDSHNHAGTGAAGGEAKRPADGGFASTRIPIKDPALFPRQRAEPRQRGPFPQRPRTVLDTAQSTAGAAGSDPSCTFQSPTDSGSHISHPRCASQKEANKDVPTNSSDRNNTSHPS